MQNMWYVLWQQAVWAQTANLQPAGSVNDVNAYFYELFILHVTFTVGRDYVSEAGAVFFLL